jgi:hypothetical protein
MKTTADIGLTRRLNTGIAATEWAFWRMVFEMKTL